MIKEKATTRVDTQIVREVLSQSYTVPANSYYDGEIDVAKNGYSFVAMIGFAITGNASGNATAYKYYKSNDTVQFSVKSTSAKAQNQEIYFYCLYVKD